jgi:zinc transporter ZupT
MLQDFRLLSQWLRIRDLSEKMGKKTKQNNQKQKKKEKYVTLQRFVGLAFHSLVDGIIIAGAFTASPETGSRVALAILLHKFPDGFVMSSIVASQHAKNPVQSIPYAFLLFILFLPSSHLLSYRLFHRDPI